jgi:hypothetical protein
MEKDLQDKISGHKKRFQYNYLSYALSSNIEIQLLEDLSSNKNPEIFFDVTEEIEDSFKFNKRTLILQSNKSKTVIYKKNLGLFTLREGKTIEFSPFTKFGLLNLSNTLLNLVFGFVLYQRDVNVLHASAVEIDNKAVLFVGPSGSGKSSLSSLFSEIGGFITEDLGVLKKYQNKIFIQKTLPIIKLENSNSERVGFLPDDQRNRSLYYSNNPVENEFTEISNIYFMEWGNSIELLSPTIKDLIYNFQRSLFSSFPFNSCKASSRQALSLISDLEKNTRIRICSRSKENSLNSTYELLDADLKCH